MKFVIFLHFFKKKWTLNNHQCLVGDLRGPQRPRVHDHSLQRTIGCLSPLYRSNSCSSACHIKNGKRALTTRRRCHRLEPLYCPGSPPLAATLVCTGTRLRLFSHTYVLGYVAFNITGRQEVCGTSCGRPSCEESDPISCRITTITQYRICSPSPPLNQCVCARPRAH